MPFKHPRIGHLNVKPRLSPPASRGMLMKRKPECTGQVLAEIITGDGSGVISSIT